MSNPAVRLHPDRAEPHEGASAHVADGPRERIGALLGRLWAPTISAVSRARSARMFHPVGSTFAGTVEPIAGRLSTIGDRLSGYVLARISAALWKREVGRFEVLGMGLRFCAGPIVDEEAAPDDQDLLFATIRSPLTMPLSPFTTDASDFVARRYWAVSPFAIAPLGRFELRLSPLGRAEESGSRHDRLHAAVAGGRAAWLLEARRTLTMRWIAVARVQLERPIELDQASLAFDPFRSGRGIVPVGLVHAIRRAAYASSQRGRPRGRAAASGS
jgi:hypothetical protein